MNIQKFTKSDITKDSNIGIIMDSNNFISLEIHTTTKIQYLKKMLLSESLFIGSLG